ncbi:hypothetical protein HTZ84_17170 [Haloterrigena sp. SYSU A558-1]|uniref:Uncharacterized protein n=1 Tax=Haloterrigena gelatinilytica TaxID=2741724 RepID=A0A8J8GLV3_9EURY|nr:hypothetical protein [Haloterrigena gelatinilytica]NUB90167.1 hypothetical protein [Haloterrigena gelatinilytica]NUC74012.1 hypothetical protein [Haloterrigena gelatinilytica]
MGYSLHYYDLVLLCIAASLGIGAGIGYATAIAIETSIAVLGLVAIAFIVHALFVNGPVDQPEELTDEVDIEEVPQVLSPVESAD